MPQASTALPTNMHTHTHTHPQPIIDPCIAFSHLESFQCNSHFPSGRQRLLICPRAPSISCNQKSPLLIDRLGDPTLFSFLSYSFSVLLSLLCQWFSSRRFLSLCLSLCGGNIFGTSVRSFTPLWCRGARGEGQRTNSY